ncbi:MAG: Energy-coupling factor transporter transmembrane protein EcfT [Calditrichaeota bacterium]|nr:Energy-coupling factor transporter transmembrane protein EcfT [Calditrichota bacterium]
MTRDSQSRANDELAQRRPPLRRLDPRARILAALLLLLQLVLLPPGPGLVAVAVLLLVFVAAGRPPLARLAVGLVAVAWMLALTLLLHAFTTPGKVLWAVPGLGWVITVEGVAGGSLLAGRLAALVLVGVTLSLAVSALETVRAIDVLLSPLARLGVAVGSVSLLLGMTLRFVPTLYAEAIQLKKALRARGWTSGRGAASRVRAWIPLFIPLLANSLRRADDLAETLVLRGYDPRAVRGSYLLSRWRARDTAALAAVSAPLCLFLFARIFA